MNAPAVGQTYTILMSPERAGIVATLFIGAHVPFKVEPRPGMPKHSAVAVTVAEVTRTSMGLAVGCSVYAEGPASYSVRRTLSYYDGSGRQHVDDYTP